MPKLNEWTVIWDQDAKEDLAFLPAKHQRYIILEVEKCLSSDPLVVSKNMKTLRPNSHAQRELRLSGIYPVLFNVDLKFQTVHVMTVGEKRKAILIVRGKEFRKHHENNPD